MDRPGLGDERDQADVAAARRAQEWKLLPDPGHEFRPRNPGSVVGAGLFMSVAAAFRGMSAFRVPAGRGIPLLADVADRQRRDSFPEPVIRCKHPVVAMPMLARQRDEIGEPVQELERRKFHDPAGSRPRGLSLSAGPDPGGGLVTREPIADASDAAVRAADHGQPVQCKGRPGAVPQEVFETLKVARHVAVDERDPDTRSTRHTSPCM